MDDKEARWTLQQLAAGRSPVVEALSRAEALATAGSSEGAEAWARIAAEAALTLREPAGRA